MPHSNPLCPGRWLCAFPLNESQELLSLDELQLLSPEQKPPLADGELLRKQSPWTEDPMTLLTQMVVVRFHAANFDFWVFGLDPVFGEFFGFARFLGSGSEGQWCQVSYEELARIRIPNRLVMGKLMSLPLSRDTNFAPRSLLEALGQPAPSAGSPQPESR